MPGTHRLPDQGLANKWWHDDIERHYGNTGLVGQISCWNLSEPEVVELQPQQVRVCACCIVRSPVHRQCVACTGLHFLQRALSGPLGGGFTQAMLFANIWHRGEANPTAMRNVGVHWCDRHHRSV